MSTKSGHQRYEPRWGLWELLDAKRVEGHFDKEGVCY
jgi:hypothetical protein